MNETDNEYPSVRVGAILKDGFCSGIFGSDSFGKKIIVALGHHWVVAQEIDAYPPKKAPCVASEESHHFLFQALEDAINYERED